MIVWYYRIYSVIVHSHNTVWHMNCNELAPYDILHLISQDQVLSSMQQKLDSLCEQMNFMKDQVETVAFQEKQDKNMDSVATGLLSFQSQICKSNDKSVLSGGWNSSIDLKVRNFETRNWISNIEPEWVCLIVESLIRTCFLFLFYLKDVAEKDSGQDEIFKMPDINNAEQEERRMSDLSDWCSSVTSSVEIQVRNISLKFQSWNILQIFKMTPAG